MKLLVRRARKAGPASAVHGRITTKVNAHVGSRYQQADNSPRRPFPFVSLFPSGSETHSQKQAVNCFQDLLCILSAASHNYSYLFYSKPSSRKRLCL